MPRARYWKMMPDEIEKLAYNEEKLLNWEIKGMKEPESDARFIGVFLYRHGAPYDYEPIKGIVFYHNNIEPNEIPKISKFLQDRFGGKEMERGSRIFLKGSKEIFSGKDISKLAREMELAFKVKTSTSLEFQDLTPEEQKAAGLPESKLLPIPGK